MYDAIIVGARCAGASLALLLARAGLRVLMLDRASFPSDKPLSTHLMHPPAIRRLRDWGLLDELVRSNCPPILRYGLVVEDVNLMAPLPPDDGVAEAYAPRRYVIDSILIEAATDAGAELRERTSVTGLVWEGERVVGVSGTSNGRNFTERAHLVVGADGTHSKVAKWVGANTYNEKRTLLASIWTYWQGSSVVDVPTWRDERNYAFAWPTNDGAVLAGVTWPVADFAEIDRADPIVPYLRVLDRMAPNLAEEIRDGEQDGRWMSGSVPNFYRESSGAGWALIGDAGYSRDPATAGGITDAIRSADLLAELAVPVLHEPAALDAALLCYEAARNEVTRPFYEYTCDFAALNPYPKDVLQILRAAVALPEQASSLTGLFSQTASPHDFFSAENMNRIFEATAPESTNNWRLRVLRAVLRYRGLGAEGARALGQRMLNSRLGEFGNYLDEDPRFRQRSVGNRAHRHELQTQDEEMTTP